MTTTTTFLNLKIFYENNSVIQLHLLTELLNQSVLSVGTGRSLKYWERENEEQDACPGAVGTAQPQFLTCGTRTLRVLIYDFYSPQRSLELINCPNFL